LKVDLFVVLFWSVLLPYLLLRISEFCFTLFCDLPAIKTENNSRVKIIKATAISLSGVPFSELRLILPVLDDEMSVDDNIKDSTNHGQLDGVTENEITEGVHVMLLWWRVIPSFLIILGPERIHSKKFSVSETFHVFNSFIEVIKGLMGISPQVGFRVSFPSIEVFDMAKVRVDPMIVCNSSPVVFVNRFHTSSLRGASSIRFIFSNLSL